MHGLSRQRSILLLPLLACACVGRSVVRLPPQNSGVLPTPSVVVLAGGTRVPVESGRFTPDSVLGTLSGGQRFAISRDSVWFVEARQVTATDSFEAFGKTILLVFSALVLLVVSVM